MMALVIVAAVGLLAMGACGVMCYLVKDDPDIKAMLGVLGAVGTMLDNTSAKALRGAGCTHAQVMDMRAFAPVAVDHPNVTEAELAKLDKMVMVICAVPEPEQAPECRELAQIFLNAVEKPPSQFSLVVEAWGQDEPVCSGNYGSLGEYIGEIPESQWRGRSPFGSAP